MMMALRGGSWRRFERSVRSGLSLALAAATILAGALAGLLQATQAAPLRADFWDCNPHPLNITFLVPGRGSDKIPNCCLLTELVRKPELEYKTWKQYLEQNPLPKQARVRRAAHLVADNETYLRQLDLAYQRIKALPDSDPRSLFQQMSFHCIYGTEQVVHQADRPDLAYSIHGHWLFFPFHRWFTFFFERILAKLLEDEAFALPFWNWDNQSEGMESGSADRIPDFCRSPDKYPNLYHKYRDPRHQPGAAPTVVNLIRESVADGFSAVSAEEVAQSRSLNIANLRSWIVDRTATGEKHPFLGFPMRAGDSVPRQWVDTFEGQAHTAVHFWVGDRALSYADMGLGHHAVRDPLFFFHHANVDRLWDVWLGLEGRTNYDDPDFLDAAFFFYDENGEIVKVTVAECLDSDLLKYTFEQVDYPWLTYVPPTLAKA